jgi:hypothetical protein
VSSRSDERSPAVAFLRAAARFVAGIFVVGYALLDELLFPLLRPLIRYLSGLRLFEGLAVLIRKLPPHAMLVVLAVPFVVIEPLKLVSLWWFAMGHIIQGGVMLVVSHGLSLLILERLYETGHDQLMQIAWFKKLMDWLVSLRDAALGWAKATTAWQNAVRVARDVRAYVRRLLRTAR